MNTPETSTGSTTDTLSWVMIGLGTLAVALGLWDVLVERDGSSGGSLVAIAVGVLVIAWGIQRWRGG